MIWPVLKRKATSFYRQPLFIQLWLLPLWVLLGVAKLLIITVSFKRVAQFLGASNGTNPWIPLVNPAQEAQALQIGRAIRMTAQYTPWDSNCFPQAVVSRWLLGLYGIPYALYFGLQRDPLERGMKAHAWVATGRIRVTGGYSFNQFTVVGCFASNMSETVTS